VGELAGWPEIGSRAFVRACGAKADEFAQVGEWVVVQPGRYRYSVSPIKRDVKRKHFSPPECQNIFRHPAPDHTADTSLLAAARSYWPVAERPHKPRSVGPSCFVLPVASCSLP